MPQLPRRVHLLCHLLGTALALVGIAGLPSAVAPWVCAASHGLGAWTHRPESDPARDTEFLGIVRTSLAIVACLVSAGQHWVVGVTGVELCGTCHGIAVARVASPRP